MELRPLKYFLMAAQKENITKSAQLLLVTPPTLSAEDTADKRTAMLTKKRKHTLDEIHSKQKQLASIICDTRL